MNIYQLFKEDPEINRIEITTDLIHLLNQLCTNFETRNKHPLALNTLMLGVEPIHFTDFDKNLFFHIFQVDENYVLSVLKEAVTVGENWIVLNDAYNQLSIYVAHRLLTSNLPKKEKEQGLTVIFKMMNYKIFTSYVNHVFEFGANRGIMEATVKNLSNKFDVVQLGTWAKVIEARAKDTFSDTSIHYKSLIHYNNDKEIFYIITDTRARITSRVKIIQNEYYKNHEDEETISSYGLSNTIDGEVVLTENDDVYNRVISGMINQIQTTARFVDNELIRVLCSQYSFMTPDLFRTVLTMFSETARLQVSTGTSEKIKSKTKNSDEYYEGLVLLVKELLQKTFRYCTLNNVPLGNKTEVLKRAKNLYTSSRISDNDVITIKRSAVVFVLGCDVSKRDTTNQALTLSLIMYIVIKALKLV